MRTEYSGSLIDPDSAPDNPYTFFEEWFNQANACCGDETNIMMLATANNMGEPHLRTVLLKEYDATGFVFFTNYESQKGQDLKENPKASLLFHWQPLFRQIRITGRAEKINRVDSAAYFVSRPFDSRISAIVSPQSRIISSREQLVSQVNELTEKFKNSSPPCPAFWGGYKVVPYQIEFWQGRPDRLHDRVLYTKEDNSWRRVRLAP